MSQVHRQYQKFEVSILRYRYCLFYVVESNTNLIKTYLDVKFRLEFTFQSISNVTLVRGIGALVTFFIRLRAW